MASFGSFPLDAMQQEHTLQLGSLRLAELSGLPNERQSDRAQAASAGEALFLLMLQLEGSSIHRQAGREASLSVGDFTLCATARPYEISLAAPARCLVMSIPDNLMRRNLACPEEVVALQMSSARGMTSVLSNFIRGLWTCRANAADAAVALRMSYTLLDLVVAAYSVSPHARHEQSSLVAAHRLRIIGYIEAHLRDPALNPTTVARACKITARYLHHLFTSESETVTQYIQRRRLEECARALIAAPVRGRLVTEIAFDYGFNSLTHFGRIFRHQYGLSPSEYRRVALELPREAQVKNLDEASAPG
jgi:AraC-like DNA-binding protein